MEEEEKQSIKDSLKCLKKYGSITNSKFSPLPCHFIKHMVTDNDTLQGITLKYGVTSEEVRRVNKLWANDSLFLRESLLIPVKNGTVSSTSSVHLIDTPSEPDLFLNQSSRDVTPNHFSRSDSLRSSSSSFRNEDDLDSYNDFLTRIDADIANKRQQMKVAQDRSLFAPELNNSIRRKPAMSRLKQQQEQQQQQVNHNGQRQVQENGFDIPVVLTQSTKVRNSLQRLQEKQEEIFEL